MIRANTEVDQLVQDNLALVKWVYSRCRAADIVAAMEFDDAIAAGNLGLLKAAQTWKPEKAAFSTHAFHLIRQHIFRESRRYARQQRLPTSQITYDPGETEQIVVYDERLPALLNHVDSLSPYERFVVRAYCGLGFPKRTMRQIAPILGIRSYQYVSHIWKQAQEKLKLAVDMAESAA